MSRRLYEALRAALAMLGLLFCLTVVAGGMKVTDPYAGWSTFISGALWIGLPAWFGLKRWVMGASVYDRP